MRDDSNASNRSNPSNLPGRTGIDAEMEASPEKKRKRRAPRVIAITNVELSYLKRMVQFGETIAGQRFFPYDFTYRISGHRDPKTDKLVGATTVTKSAIGNLVAAKCLTAAPVTASTDLIEYALTDLGRSIGQGQSPTPLAVQEDLFDSGEAA